MSTEEKIDMALAKVKMSRSELARRLGTSPQNLYMKIKRNTLNDDDMQRIAKAIGCEWKSEFYFGG